MSIFGFTFISDKKLSMYKNKEEKVKFLEKANDSLLAELRGCEALSNEKGATISSLNNEMDSKDKEILSIAGDLDKMNKEVDNLKNNQKKLMASIKSKTEELADANMTIHDLQETHESNLLIISNLRADLKAKEDELDKLKKTIEEASEAVEDSTEPVSDEEDNQVTDAVIESEEERAADEKETPEETVDGTRPDDTDGNYVFEEVDNKYDYVDDLVSLEENKEFEEDMPEEVISSLIEQIEEEAPEEVKEAIADIDKQPEEVEKENNETAEEHNLDILDDETDDKDHVKKEDRQKNKKKNKKKK